jgi:CRISPR-associated protein Cmr2
LLSEVSRAVATEVSQHGALVFPEAISSPNVANVIVANLNKYDLDVQKIQHIVSDAKAAAQNCWLSYALPVLKKYKLCIREIIWEDQINDVLEFSAAWAPHPTGAYREARAKVMRLLAGRKNCRDFSPGRGRVGVPKSSLDGLRETVLVEGDRKGWPKALRVRTGEQLDVIGLVKRVAEGHQPYPSVSRIAADPWIRGIVKSGGDEVLRKLAKACAGVPDDKVHHIDWRTYPRLKDFPYEGTTLFRLRHHEWWEETSDEPNRLRDRVEPPAWYPPIDGALREVERFAASKHLGEEPNPYLAVIVADGDKMGETISRLTSDVEHREFSKTLANFAEQAGQIVQKYHGVLVYSGGDDVFAFAPVDQCLDCSRDLHDCFGRLLKIWGDKTQKQITLSVGVAIAHFLENLEDLREFGQAAEKHAKTADKDGVKNAIAVHLHKRGGSPVKVRERWTDPKPSHEGWANAPDTRITELAAMLRERLLPSRLATDLQKLAKDYKNWPSHDPDKKELLKQAISRDVLRVIVAKQPGRAGDVRARLQPALDRISGAESLRQLAEELLIARQIAVACRQANADKVGGKA